ncbi:MAG: branched-chain amino acid ABC transporter permease [Acidobacteriota bacterium]|nr:branched-chain amino acid ABC transporter permease [Acidobacteriota bacterium]
MTAWSYYIATLTVYFGVNVLSGLSLNLQFGYAGVVNFGYIIFQSVGAYIAAVVVLGPSSGTFQQYVFGAHLPFGVALLLATAAGAVLSLLIGLFSLRNIRRDYQAAILLIISLIATQVVQGYVPLFNGSNGVTGIPRPLFSTLPVSLQGYQWAYAGWVLALAAIVYVLVRWLSRSPWGRALRAMRDQEDAAAALGLNVTALRLQVFVIGGAIAGLSGGLLVEYIGAWSPDAWGYAETFVIFTAIFVGGLGNYAGVVLGVLLVPILFLELPRFLPQVGYPGLMDSIEWIAIGAIWMLCLYVRPQGLFPERRNRARRPAAGPLAEPRPEQVGAV